jgi:PAS domain S-box-containing protein
MYNPGLVALSLAIASLSAFVALSVSNRIVAATTPRGRLTWACAGAVSMGGGIWAMHFIGMLAFALPCGVSYDPLGTVVSMAPGILASGAALSVISRTTAPGLARLLGGALLMGGGIGAMHYSGMAAMRPEALLLYDPAMVGVSVLVAAVLAFMSLGVHFGLRQTLSLSRVPATVVAATIMGVAVSGMHYTAMDAARFYPLESAISGGLHLPNTLLAMLIAMFAVVVASAALAASYAGRQIDLVEQLSQEMKQRAAVERDAQRSRARTQAIVDAVADAIITFDRSGRIRQWSRGAERIFGYAAREIISTELSTLLPARPGAQPQETVESLLSSHDFFGVGRELTAIRKDGGEFPIDLTVTEVKGIDEVLFTVILRDITDVKRARQELVDARQQAEAASRAKSEFLATMSHEIRTPMNGVLGMANLLASTPLNDRQSRLTENLMRSGQALMAIINDILDFSKIEAGRLDLLEADFDPREVIAEVADLFSERCATKGLEFVYFVDEEVPTNLRSDPLRLRQVCMNLVSNAIKFTERGEILVEMGVAETRADHVVLSVAVTDTGIGIAPGKQAAVFESFHQVDSSMTRARGGSGLGLAIVKQLVNLMGGDIGVESELGRGSRFWFTVRAGKSASAAAARAPRHLARRLSVLLVDANAVSAHVTSQYMEGWGLKPSAHNTPGEATAAWDAAVTAGTGFDVAIIDLKGLGKAGSELATRIRTDRRRKAPAEVIFLTSVDTFVGEGGDHHQAFATLSKPIRPSELFDCLASIAAGRPKRHVSALLARRTARATRPQFDAWVLVAEDNAINQDVAVGMLNNLGCGVVTVPNGVAAIEACAQDNFDLILMDCEMPDMDGFEATRRIRETERMMNELPENRARPKHIPIIAVTAHALPEMRAMCAQAGMDDFLSKPFDDLQLTEAMRRQLASRSPVLREAAVPAAAGDDAAGEPIDAAAIQQIRVIEARGSKGLLKRVLTRFIDSGPAMAADIRAKFHARDTDALWKAAHGLKSSASAVGAVQVSMRCGEIEVAARQSGADATAGMIELLDAELAAAVRSLQSLLGEADATLH